MTGADRVRWDQIYRDITDTEYPAPDPLLYNYTPPISDQQEHRALDLACGLGQNGLWLAEQGYVVDLMDVSRVALLRAQTEAGKRGVRNLNLYPVDFDQHEFPDAHYELVCVFRYLKRDLFTHLRRCIQPGGRIIYETFNMRYLDLVPGFNPAYLLEPGELLGYFADWKLVTTMEESHVSRVVAIKPGK